MAEPETSNTHLHKVLSHRNHIHNVSLQKQLKVYDRQKKLVEKELFEITKVREAIQQINRATPKRSPKVKKRSITPNKSQNKSSPSLLMKSDTIVKERNVETTSQDEKETVNDEERHYNVEGVRSLGSKIETPSSIQSFQMMQKKDDNATRSLSPKDEPRKESKSKIKPVTQVSIDNQFGEKRAEPRLERNGNSTNIKDLKDGEMKRENDATNGSQSAYNEGNEKLFTRRRPPYIKSSSSPSLPVQKLEELVAKEINENEHCEIYRLPKTPTRIAKDRRCSISDDDLYKKTLLVNHENARTRLPALIASWQDHNHGNNVQDFAAENQKRYHNSSPSLGGFTNNEYSFEQRPRARSKTVSDLETTKTWKFPERQRKNTNSAHILRDFPTNKVCVLERSRARSKTVCNVDKSFSEYRRPRSNTESCFFHPSKQQRSTRDSNSPQGNFRPRSTPAITGEQANSTSNNSESIGLSEEETIAIKGKFRQIGHSVLAIALMKKMASKK